MIRRAALLIVMLLVLPGCAAEPDSVISTGDDGLRTFSVIREINGTPVLCPAFALVDPVHGVLDGRPGASEPVWIAAEDGRQLSVIWPAGFAVRFEAGAVLYDERAEQVAWEGQPVELSQVEWDSAAGTYDDPYIASGLLFEGCYPYLP